MRDSSEQPFLRDLRDVDTCVFDYGGVVSFHYCEPWQGNIARILNVSPEEARSLLSESSPQGRDYRLGRMPREQFWATVCELAGANGANVADLEDNWAQSYQIDRRMLELIERLRSEVQFRVGILSNTDKYRHDHINRTYDLSRKVDFVVSSYVHGVIKPEESAYLKTLEAAGRSDRPEKVLYVDDRDGHVAAAAALGIQGFVFSAYEQFHDLLKEHRILP